MHKLTLLLSAFLALVSFSPLQFVFCEEKLLTRIRRGNVGERYSGGLGSRSSHGVGYRGSTALGSHQNSGSPVVFDQIALWAVSGPAQQVVDGYQAQINAQASSAQTLDRLQQHGQHSAAAAGAAANQASAWYNAIATGHVPAGYKGERGRK